MSINMKQRAAAKRKSVRRRFWEQIGYKIGMFLVAIGAVAFIVFFLFYFFILLGISIVAWTIFWLAGAKIKVYQNGKPAGYIKRFKFYKE